MRTKFNLGPSSGRVVMEILGDILLFLGIYSILKLIIRSEVRKALKLERREEDTNGKM